MAHETELEVALEAADLATAIIRTEYERFGAMVDPPVDVTTYVDRASQDAILDHLHRRFPADALCAEEASELLKSVPSEGRRVWIVDPIDGTRGFVTKNGEFSVMIGFVEDGVVRVGVVAEPAKGRVTYASREGGCWARTASGTSVACQVGKADDLTAATLVQSHPKQADDPTGPVRILGPARVLQTYSAGVKLALVARGEADLYVLDYPRFNDWDVCAGEILVTESGGRVTTVQGETLRYGLPGHRHTSGLIATNGVIHDQVLDRLRTAGFRLQQ